MHTHQRAGGQPTGEEAAIIEVNGVDEAVLLPDEDFLFQCVTMYYADLDPSESAEMKATFLRQVLPEIRVNLEVYAGRDWFELLNRQYQNKVFDWAKNLSGMMGWEASIAGLGTCAHKGAIGPASITRVAYFSKPHPILRHYAGLNPTIELHCYRKDLLAACNGWIFGDSRHGPNNEVYDHREGFRLWRRGKSH